MSKDNTKLDDFYAIENILQLLDIKGRLAMTKVCKSWRDVCIKSTSTFPVVTIKKPLDTEEKLEDFCEFAYNFGHQFRELRLDHVDSIRNNQIAKEILEYTVDSLKVLDLVVRKSTRKRRGLPSKARIDWLPQFKQIERFSLQAEWLLEEDWKLGESMPTLKHFEVGGSWAHQFEIAGGLPAHMLPTGIMHLQVFSPFNGVETLIRHLPSLESVVIQHDLRDKDEGEENRHRWQDRPLAALATLSNLTSLVFSDDFYEPGHHFPGVEDLGKLTNLQKLDLILTRIRYIEREAVVSQMATAVQKLSQLTSLKLNCLLIYGNPLNRSPTNNIPFLPNLKELTLQNLPDPIASFPNVEILTIEYGSVLDFMDDFWRRRKIEQRYPKLKYLTILLNPLLMDDDGTPVHGPEGIVVERPTEQVLALHELAVVCPILIPHNLLGYRYTNLTTQIFPLLMEMHESRDFPNSKKPSEIFSEVDVRFGTSIQHCVEYRLILNHYS